MDKKEYLKQWNKNNKDKVKKWREANREKIRQKHKEWRKNNPDKVKRHLKNQTKYLKDRREKLSSENRILIKEIKKKYGCLNPNCSWNGEFKPYHLDFHHLKDKKFNIGNHLDKTQPQLIIEIRKCTLLCACCHRDVTWGNLDAKMFPLCTI
jgi:hypothetical protein